MKLALIADDFTGANDLALQLIKYGIKIVTTSKISSLGKNEVEVITSESRNIDENIAKKIVGEIIDKFNENTYEKLFKKIDSTLRGNVRVEVEELRKKIGDKPISYVVPFPSVGRIIKNGKHYVDGIELSKSIFGQDPICPVKTSDIEDYFPGRIISLEEIRSGNLVEILKEASELDLIFEGEKEEDIDLVGEALVKSGRDKYVVGSSRIMESLLKYWGFSKSKVLVIAGSCNNISLEQVRSFSEKNKLKTYDYKVGKKLLKSGSGEDILIRSIREKEEMSEDLKAKSSKEIKKELVEIAVDIIKKEKIKKIISSGGDISMELMEKLGLDTFEVTNYIEAGISYGRSGEYEIITKPGGFGSENIYEKMYSFMKNCR